MWFRNWKVTNATIGYKLMYVLGWDDCNLFQATNLFPGCLCAPFFCKVYPFFCKTWGSCTYYVITDRGGLLQTITVLPREGSWVPHTYFEKWFFRKPFRLIPWLLKRALHLVCASYHVYIAVEVTLNMSKQPAWQFGKKIFFWKFFGWNFWVKIFWMKIWGEGVTGWGAWRTWRG